MPRITTLLPIAMALVAPLAGAGCGSTESSAGGGGGDDAGSMDASKPPDGADVAVSPDGNAWGGPVSVPAGSPVTIAQRAADGTVSGTYVDPHTQQRFSFSVRATVVGAHVLRLDPATGDARPEVLVSVVRAFSTTDIVYNLKTTQSSYVAAGILVHNKCLARGSLVDTPEGAVPIEALRPGERVYGEVDGHRVATRVLRTYEKTTLLGRLPGRRLAPHLLVIENHRVVTPRGETVASSLPAPAEDAVGDVYDLATETGNYWAEGVLLRAASSSTAP